jgi:hypothetical protein
VDNDDVVKDDVVKDDVVKDDVVKDDMLVEIRVALLQRTRWLELHND